MKRRGVALLSGLAVLLAVPAAQEVARANGARTLRADLHGFEEPPAVSSTGSGEFRARISPDETSFEYELTFEDLEGDVLQAHISRPEGRQPREGMASRTVTAADVIGPAGQGIAAGEFAEVLAAMREGATYANVHSTRNPPGEIRGQIKGRASDERRRPPLFPHGATSL